MNEFNIEKYKLPPNQEDSDCLGIAIRQSKTNSQKKHIGFVFIDKDSKKSMFAHLADDYYCQENKLRGYGILWLDFLSERNATIIITQLKLLSVKGIDIKSIYGITNSGGTLIENGEIIKNPNTDSDSLTCSTFLLCILEQAGFEIIDRSTWIINSEDAKWQESMMEMLKDKLYEDFYEEQKNNIGKVVRIRPEQLAGACGIYKYTPISYTDACQAGQLVVDRLNELF